MYKKRSHLFLLDGEEKLELVGEFFLGVKSIGEINSSNSAVSMNLYSESLDVTGTISSSSEIRQVELNLIPSFIESHGHSTDERFHSGGTLKIKIILDNWRL